MINAGYEQKPMPCILYVV